MNETNHDRNAPPPKKRNVNLKLGRIGFLRFEVVERRLTFRLLRADRRARLDSLAEGGRGAMVDR